MCCNTSKETEVSGTTWEMCIALPARRDWQNIKTFSIENSETFCPNEVSFLIDRCCIWYFASSKCLGVSYSIWKQRVYIQRQLSFQLFLQCTWMMVWIWGWGKVLVGLKLHKGLEKGITVWKTWCRLHLHTVDGSSWRARTDHNAIFAFCRGVCKVRLWGFQHSWRRERNMRGCQTKTKMLCRYGLQLWPGLAKEAHTQLMEALFLLQYVHAVLPLPRYTSKGPTVYAIFLTWPQDSMLKLPSPLTSSGTQVRNVKK